MIQTHLPAPGAKMPTTQGSLTEVAGSTSRDVRHPRKNMWHLSKLPPSSRVQTKSVCVYVNFVLVLNMLKYCLKSKPIGYVLGQNVTFP